MFQGDFVKMVPEKWEPGQRAAVVKHKDNLVGFLGILGIVEHGSTFFI